MDDAAERGNGGNGPMTAADLLAQLESDPAWVAARAERERQLARREAELGESEAPLAQQLREAGIDVESAWDLVKTYEPYPDAIPILLAHLHRPYPDRVREGIARALAVPDAHSAWHEIVELYRLTDPDEEPDTKDGLAVCLAAIAGRGNVEEVIVLIRDRSLGPSRVVFLRVLTRLRVPQAWELVAECARDPELRRQAEHMLHQRELRRRSRSHESD